MTSVAVRVFPCVSASTHKISVAVRVCQCVSVSTHRTSVAVRVCPCVSVSKHRTSVDCSGDFGPRGLSVQYTQDVRGTHRTSVAVHQYTYQHAGPWTQHTGPSRGLFGTSMGVHQHTQDVRGCPCVSVCVCVCPSVHTGRPWLSIVHTGRPWVFASIHRTSVAVCGYPSAHTGHPWLSVCVRVCPSAHTGRPWLSISTHISTLVPGLSMLALPVDCSGDFGQSGLSGQYTQDVSRCPPAHTRRPWLSASTHRTYVAVCVCPCVSVSTHRTSEAVHHTHMTFVGVRQHIQDVQGCPWLSVSTHRTSVAGRVFPVCPSAHTRCMWLSVCVSVCPSAHTGRPWLSVCVRVFCVGPSACTGRPWTVRVILAHVGCLFSTHRTSVGVRQHTHDIRGCQWLSVSTHMTSVAVCVCPSAHTGRQWLSISTHISTLVLGLSTLALPVDCSGDIGQCGLSVQYTQYVRGCLSEHTGRPWVFVSTHRTSVAVHVCLCVSVCVRQHTQDFRGCPSVHISARCTHRKSVGVRQHTHDVRGCLWLSVSTHRMSVAVRVCPSAHTGHPWPSISTHIRTLVPGLSMLALPVDCSGDFGPSGLSGQYTQDVSRCPPAHTGRLRLSVCVRVCPSAHKGRLRLSISTHISTTHMTFVGVRQHTQDVRGCPWLSVSTHRTSVAVRVFPCVYVSTHKMSVAVRVCQCVSISTHRTSVAVCVCPCVSVSTHRTSVECSGDFGPRGLYVQYTQDVRGCPPAHTGHPWLSVAVRQHTHDVRCGPCVSVSTHRTSVAVHQYTYQHAVHTVRPWMFVSTHRTSMGVRQHTQDVRGCPTHRMSVGVRQHTHDIRGCQWLSVSTHMTSVAVRVCSSAHTGRPWLSISTHINTLVLGLTTLALPVDCSGDIGQCGLSVQYTQYVRGCLSEHTVRNRHTESDVSSFSGRSVSRVRLMETLLRHLLPLNDKV
ncbi:hypothetical protein YC2023_004406 [Brassica napus]